MTGIFSKKNHVKVSTHVKYVDLTEREKTMKDNTTKQNILTSKNPVWSVEDETKKLKDFIKRGGEVKDLFFKQQEKNVRATINNQFDVLFPNIPFSKLELASNKFSNIDTRNEHFFIEIKSTTHNIEKWGHDIPEKKIKNMLQQACVQYAKDKKRRDILLVVQRLYTSKISAMYLFNLTKCFDLSRYGTGFNSSNEEWPWSGSEVFLTQNKFNEKHFVLNTSQGVKFYDNSWRLDEME